MKNVIMHIVSVIFADIISLSLPSRSLPEAFVVAGLDFSEKFFFRTVACGLASDKPLPLGYRGGLLIVDEAFFILRSSVEPGLLSTGFVEAVSSGIAYFPRSGSTLP